MQDLLDNNIGERKNRVFDICNKYVYKRGLISSLVRLDNSKDVETRLKQEGISKQEVIKLIGEMIECGEVSFVARNINAFCIDKDEMFRLCDKLIDIGSGDILIENFDKFDLIEEEKRFDIAVKLVNKGLGCGLIDNLSRFKILEENNKVELIRKIMTYTGCKITPYMVRNLEKFNLMDSKSRQSLANQLIDIRHGDLLIDNIAKFKIDVEEELLALIDRLIELNYGYELINNIEDFNLDLRKKGFVLARKLVKNNGYKLIFNIKKFKIEEEENRLYIARQLLKGYMYVLVENIELFDLSDKCELLEEFVIRDKKETYLDKSLDRYEKCIANINRIFNIVLFKGRVSLDVIVSYKDSVKAIANTKLLEDEVEVCERTMSNIDKLVDYCCNREVNFALSEILGTENSSKIMSAIFDIKEDSRKNDAQEIIEKMVFACNNVSGISDNKDELTELILELIVVRDVKLKKELMPIVAKFINDGNLSRIKDEQRNSSKKKSFPAINAVVFNRLLLYKEGNEEVLSNMRNAFDNSNFLRNSMDVRETFKKIVKLESLQLEHEKLINILVFLCKRPKNICKNLGYILDIITLRGEDFIDGTIQNFDEKELQRLFYCTYTEFLSMNEDKNFIDNYENFINRSDNVKRNLGEYVLKYIADNKCDRDVMEVMKKIVSTMHDMEEFRNYKYNIKGNKHLERLQSIDNEVYLKWINEQQEFEYTRGDGRAQITDDPVDLFLLGTEIDGSCQSVNGGGEFNKCLMEVVGDGKTKAVIVKENDRIIARCILRLLVNKSTNRIILVREKMYKVNGTDDRIVDDLNEESIRYARWLGVSLVCEDIDSLISYKMTLVSYGGQAKYEYVDIAKELFDTNGEYSVSNDRLVYLYKV